MNNLAELKFFDYAVNHGLALFPLPRGQKSAAGIVGSWIRDHSRDVAQWHLWLVRHKPNFGVVAEASGIFILDVDASRVGRERAWSEWCKLCSEWGLPGPMAPAVQSARGGWHCYIRRPADAPSESLRHAAVLVRDSDGHEIIGVKVRNGYALTPGSEFDGLPYVMLHEAPPPHQCPPGLIEAVRRPVVMATPGKTGESDPLDLAALVDFLARHDEFQDYDAWIRCGMACKLAAGDDGLGAWQCAHDGTVDADTESQKWASFSAEPTPGCVTVGSLIRRARALNWNGVVRRSTEAMFGDALAAPPSTGGVPLLHAQSVIADLGRPIIETFLAAQSGQPAADAPKLPDVIHTHPLFDSLNLAIAHVLGLAERAPKTFRASAAVDMLAVLSAAHETTFGAVCARIRAAGAPLPDSRLNSAVRRFEAQVSREIRTGAGWATDNKGMPDGSNTDNVAIFAREIGADFRFNTWSQRAEIRWAPEGDWASLQEKDFNYLLTTAANGQYNFRPRESMFKRAISALAHETTFDPVLTRIAAAHAAWDGRPRLDSWLAKALGVPDDAYHRAVGRNLAGGICKRARRPGSKHDEVVILIGPEDTLKSTFCRVIALDDDWFTDSVAFEGSPQNIVPQLFGKLVIELAELDGMARREVQYIKRFLSAQSDNVTLKYEAFASDHARRVIFIGTTNESNPLRDATGNRRFLPVRIQQRIDIEFVRANIEQIIGEAATLEAAGELFLIPHDVLPEARARQEEARAESDFEIHLSAWFAGKSGAAWILPSDLATLLKDATGRSVPSNQYGGTMRRLGFLQSTPRVAGVPTRVWCRGGMESAQRYTVHRSGDGRLSPKLSTLAPPHPPIGTATVLPLVRAQ